MDERHIRLADLTVSLLAFRGVSDGIALEPMPTARRRISAGTEAAAPATLGANPQRRHGSASSRSLASKR